MNKNTNLQVMAINAIKQFLVSEREYEIQLQLEYQRQRAQQEKIIRRILNSGLRFCGTAFRQAHQWTIAERNREYALVKKQRGVIISMLDKNARLMRAGYNKLVEGGKARAIYLKDKIKFVLKSLVDKDAQFILAAYNGLKQNKLRQEGVG